MTRRAPWQSLSPKAKDALHTIRSVRGHRKLTKMALRKKANALPPAPQTKEPE